MALVVGVFELRDDALRRVLVGAMASLDVGRPAAPTAHFYSACSKGLAPLTTGENPVGTWCRSIVGRASQHTATAEGAPVFGRHQTRLDKCVYAGVTRPCFRVNRTFWSPPCLHNPMIPREKPGFRRQRHDTQNKKPPARTCCSSRRRLTRPGRLEVAGPGWAALGLASPAGRLSCSNRGPGSRRRPGLACKPRGGRSE